MFAILADCFATLAAGDAGFFTVELVGRAFFMRGPSTGACNVTLFVFIHRGKATMAGALLLRTLCGLLAGLATGLAVVIRLVISGHDGSFPSVQRKMRCMDTAQRAVATIRSG
jgi:hypothetical protein